jgi:integrase
VNVPVTFTSIAPTLGHVRLAALDQHTLRRFFVKLAAAPSRRGGTLSVSSQRKVHSRLLSACTYGEARRWLVGNPMRAIRTPTELPDTDGRAATLSPVEKALTPRERRPFEEWIAKTYADHPTYRVRWRIAFDLGLRQAEALGLTWDVIDHGSRTITIRQQLRAVKHSHGCGPAVDGISACTIAARVAAEDPSIKPISAYRCPDRVTGGHWIVATTKSKRIRHVKMSAALADELTPI